MRVIAVLAVALLLSGCTWVRRELDLSPVPPTPPPAPVKPVEPRPPHRPTPTHFERPPAAAPAQSVTATPTTPPAPDYSARCHAMADNRADDARQLGASQTDLSKVQQDVYRDCMAQSPR
jgi:hypothetical protein